MSGNDAAVAVADRQVIIFPQIMSGSCVFIDQQNIEAFRDIIELRKFQFAVICAGIGEQFKIPVVAVSTDRTEIEAVIIGAAVPVGMREIQFQICAGLLRRFHQIGGIVIRQGCLQHADQIVEIFHPAAAGFDAHLPFALFCGDHIIFRHGGRNAAFQRRNGDGFGIVAAVLHKIAFPGLQVHSRGIVTARVTVNHTDIGRFRDIIP